MFYRQTQSDRSTKKVLCPICGDSPARKAFEKKGRSFYDCSRCSLRMQAPLPSLGELSHYYETEFQQGMYRDFMNAEKMKDLTAQYRLKKVSRWQEIDGPWLDVGCANGVFVEAALAAGIEASGIEISRTAVKQAEEKGLNVIESQIEDLPVDSQYVCITAFDVIEHVLKPDEFLKQIASRLKPQGICALTLPNVNSVYSRLMGKNWWFYIPEEHLHYFCPSTIERLADSVGLEVVHVRRVSKPLTLDYGLLQFKVFNPLIFKGMSIICRCLPARLRRQVIPFAIGEMLVILRSPVKTVAGKV